MSDPKKHHYLPQFYLKQWAITDGELTRFYRPYCDVVADEGSPASFGYAPGLYSLDGYSNDMKNILEKEYFSRAIDNDASKTLQIFVECNISKLTPELRIAWTRFLMSLKFRTPHQVAQVCKEAEKTLRENLLLHPEEYEAARNNSDPATLLEWTEKHAPALFPNYGKQILPQLIDNQDIGQQIIKMHWQTVKFSHAFPDLLTSDNPLHLSHNLQDQQCVIALPLSPNLVFFATRNPMNVQAIMSNGSVKVAKALNSIIVTQAATDVYGNSNQQVTFVKKHLRQR